MSENPQTGMERLEARELALQRGVQIRTVAELGDFARAVHASGLTPKSLDTPAKVLVALQTGMEAGLSPMKALQSVVVINGTPSWKGDAARALVNNSGLLKRGTKVRTWVDGAGDDMVGWCETHRAEDLEPERTSFSADDAKKAGLWKKAGPWSQYPKRMLQYRAMGFHLRDHFPEVLLGFYIDSEGEDIEPRREPINITPAPPPGHEAPPAWALEAEVPAAAEPLPAPAPAPSPASESADPPSEAPEVREPEIEEPPACPHPVESYRLEEEGDERVAYCGDCGEEMDRLALPSAPEPEPTPEPEPAPPASAERDARMEALGKVSKAIEERAEQFVTLGWDKEQATHKIRNKALEHFGVERFNDLPTEKLAGVAAWARNVKLSR